MNRNIVLILGLLLFFLHGVFAQKKPSADKKTRDTAAAVTSLGNGELTAKNIAQGRDLSLYEEGGYFDCREWLIETPGRKTCDENKLRDFILRQWNEKKRAYVRVTYDSVDAMSTSHIFIEPDQKGSWYVAWRIARSHAIRELNDRITDIERIVSVERVEDKPKKGDWALTFKNASGKILIGIPEY